MSPELRSILEAAAYLVGAIIIIVMRQKSAEQRKQVAADLDAHKRTVAASAQAQTQTFAEEIARKHNAELEAIKTSLTEEVTALRGSHTFLNGRVNILTDELTAEREHNRQLKATVESKDTEIALLRVDLSALKDKVAQIERERDVSIQALVDATDREKMMQSRIDALERRLTERDIEIARLEERVKAYQEIMQPFFAQVARQFNTPPVEPMPLEPAA